MRLASLIDRARLVDLLRTEDDRYVAEHGRSRVLAEQASRCLLNGLPMNWMDHWPVPFPLFFEEASGARLRDVDGHEYIDLCLGDTGAMAGHSPPATAEALAYRARHGLTAMLPTEDAIAAGDALAARFGLPYWQFAMTATDANRFALRIARHVTGRQKVLVFDWCYHGSLDETMVMLAGGSIASRQGVVGRAVPPEATSVVVPFNDIPALEAALRGEQVACVLAEPALTNIGIILPEPDFHSRLRTICSETGTLLVLDETHTLCIGPGGATKAWGLSPDMLVVGKAIGGGMPVAAFGLSERVADAASAIVQEQGLDVSGVGGTLSGNALALAAVRATLGSYLTESDFERTTALATRWAEGVQKIAAQAGLEWSVSQLGCRAEHWPGASLRTGADAAMNNDEELDRYLHLFALNRGVLITPFHNMVLMSPATEESDVDRHLDILREALSELGGTGR